MVGTTTIATIEATAIIGTTTVGEFNAQSLLFINILTILNFCLNSGNRGYGGRPNDRADFGNSYNRRRDDHYQNGPRSFDLLLRNGAILM